MRKNRDAFPGPNWFSHPLLPISPVAPAAKRLHGGKTTPRTVKHPWVLSDRHEFIPGDTTTFLVFRLFLG